MKERERWVGISSGPHDQRLILEHRFLLPSQSLSHMVTWCIFSENACPPGHEKNTKSSQM